MSKQSKYDCNPEFWVDSYSDEFYRFALYRLNNHEQAEDIVQETFLSALNNLKNFRQDCAEKTWLYNILKNKIIDCYRKNKRSELSESSSFQEMDDDQFLQRFFRQDGMYIGHWKAETVPHQWANAADDNLLSEEFMNLLQECLTKLPDKQADVFRLKNMEDFSTSEICKELELSSSNLWVLIHRAKLQLRECLEKKGMKDG